MIQALGQFFRLAQITQAPPNVDFMRKDLELADATCSWEQAQTWAQQDFNGLRKELQATRGFAVPPWSVPQAIWRHICASDGEFVQIILQFLALLRFTMLVSLKWAVSLGVPWKKNEKIGTLAFRVLHLLDPFSKGWFKVLWSRHGFTPAPTNFGTWPGRRREEAVMLNRVLQYRLLQAGISCFAALWDQSNAFNSIKWEALETAPMKRLGQSDKYFLQLRNRRSLCLQTDNHNTALVYLVGTGTRQGDTPATQEFSSAFQRVTQQFDKQQYNVLESMYFVARHPWIQRSIFLASSLWADDFLRWRILLNNGNEKAACDQLDAKFKQAVNSVGLDLNPKKTQFLVCFAGTNASSRERSFRIAINGTELQKLRSTNATHLGSIYSQYPLEADHGCKQEIRAHLDSAKRAWRRFWFLWSAPNLDLRYRVFIYKGAVISTLLSGLESCVFNQCSYDELEKWNISKLRFILQGQAFGWTNEAVRRFCQVHTIQSILQARRFGFWQTIFAKD